MLRGHHCQPRTLGILPVAMHPVDVELQFCPLQDWSTVALHPLHVTMVFGHHLGLQVHTDPKAMGRLTQKHWTERRTQQEAAFWLGVRRGRSLGIHARLCLVLLLQDAHSSRVTEAVVLFRVAPGRTAHHVLAHCQAVHMAGCDWNRPLLAVRALSAARQCLAATLEAIRVRLRWIWVRRRAFHSKAKCHLRAR